MQSTAVLSVGEVVQSTAVLSVGEVVQNTAVLSPEEVVQITAVTAVLSLLRKVTSRVWCAVAWESCMEHSLLTSPKEAVIQWCCKICV